MLLDAVPGDGNYKTALRDQYDDEQLAELAGQARAGHGKWSHEALLLAVVIDRLGVIASGRSYEAMPDPYPRPGIIPPGQRRRGNSKARAILRAIAREHADLHGYTLDDPTQGVEGG